MEVGDRKCHNEYVTKYLARDTLGHYYLCGTAFNSSSNYSSHVKSTTLLSRVIVENINVGYLFLEGNNNIIYYMSLILLVG